MRYRIDFREEGPGVSAHANKELVRRWFGLLSESRLDEAAELTDPDGTFWAPRTRTEFAFRDWYGVYGRMVGERFTDGMRFDLGLLTAEEDRVAVQAAGVGTRRAGGDYCNHYHFWVEVTHGRIRRVREYADTLYGQEAFG
jgi:ketosteroid isomerase-like protein